MSDENVRVVGGQPVAYLAQARQARSEAQRAQDEILDHASEHAESALEHAEKALDWLAVLTPPRHRQVPVYLQQLIEEIAELRRVRQ